MKLLTPITANQLTKGMKSFAGQEVTNPDKPHVVVKINSTATSIEEGMWLVEYTDGTKEVWNDEKIKADAIGFPVNIDLAALEAVLGTDGKNLSPDEMLELFYSTGIIVGTASKEKVDSEETPVEEEKMTQEPDLAEDVRIDDETPKETETKS